MRVPEVTSPDCECSEGAMTVKHVLLKCPRWSTEREELINPLRTTSIKRILTSKAGGRAAIKLVQRTKILDQFKAVVEQEEGGRTAENRGEEEEETEEEVE
ncbi:hypothetical protein GJ744_005222 [Endocarpon pusillum]|uniref:Uncharacterized protein n=1 Tax=Endocarpon pusillum TaxID=364733 RepID=A0A8H7A844_9EURO|nr:hypothetical protein GJ744_005222 [Endocarpon pusillum]